MKIAVTSENLDFFQCFSSEKKLKIIELLIDKPMNIGEIANELDVSSTIITRHINALESAGLITCQLSPGKRGLKKVCSISANEVILDFTSKNTLPSNSITFELPIGHYSNYKVEPTCGLASVENYIGMVDDPRYFSNPEKTKASLLWFQSGYVEYELPSYLFDKTDQIQSINISLELCSEFPGHKDEFPSDIHFYINDELLGFWTSPGNFGNKKGTYTPDWFSCGTEYGLLKTLIVDNTGSYIDGVKLSDVKLSQLKLNNKNNQRLRLSSPKETSHPGGVTIFGKGYGNYDQDIKVTINYK